MISLSRAIFDVPSVTIPSYSGFCHSCSFHQIPTYFSPSANRFWGTIKKIYKEKRLQTIPVKKINLVNNNTIKIKNVFSV